MANYILRMRERAEAGLWNKVKARAEREGRALKFVIVSLLREYVAHGLRQDEEPRSKAS